MLKKNKDLEIETSTQGDFYIGTVERPNKWGITEQKIHEKLGDIHKNRPQRLTPEEKEIIRKWKEWNLQEIPEDWQSKFKNFLEVSKELSEWKKYFKELKPLEVKTEYDKPRETHTTADLKPNNLPADWETQIKDKGKLNEQIKELSKRPTQEQLNQAVNNEKDKYKDYDKIKTDFVKWKNDLNNFLNNYGVNTLEALGKYIENVRTNPTLSPEQKEAIENYKKFKEQAEAWSKLFKEKPEEVRKDLDDKTKLTTSWHNIFKDKQPHEINEIIEELKKKRPNEMTKWEKEQLADYKKWKDAFKDLKKEPPIIRKEYDELKERLSTAIKNLNSEQDKNKGLKDELKKTQAEKPNPLEKAIEDKLREVVVGEEWQRPYLIKALERFLTWKADENPKKRKAAFKYWNIIINNITWLQNNLNNPLEQI